MKNRPIRISVFNHKGGVGKTTLTMNIGAALAALGRRVLLVDSDPQCNLTSYLVEDDVVDDLLDNSDSPNGQTIWSALAPVSEATGPVKKVVPFELGIEGMHLIPGDIRLSEFENDLSEFWNQCLARKLRGFRGTTALSDLVDSVVSNLEIDYVFYDSGPNIGPLNRVILLDCDFFVVPVSCDLFSLRALKTLSRSLVDWVETWSTIDELAPEGLSRLAGRPTFLGYIPQGFRVYAGSPISAQSAFLSRIDREVQEELVRHLGALTPPLVTREKKAQLGDVKHFGTLVPNSQREGLPIWEATGTANYKEEAWEAFSGIAREIEARIGRAGDAT